ncbi:ribose 5-phosphate isomerase B [Thermosulfurimonas marina]|uniref:Ribose 5-phosphate isomerase B n=1 Tax=Thermosulfurimonas marina TaxID=2047767 RepID=A0A6H1WTK5_9BACT|nr:ribose 5-phosphate isomerase B [Thermosulfurimonas marina]QJA06479.1 ribose 5-phosphate isomerase B [Thermosulfurimonas marina]
MRIVLASDHAGFELKERIKEYLQEMGHEVLDVGCHSCESVDYPVFGAKGLEKLLSGQAERGIFICGTGLGMTIMANRFPGIRAALCHDCYTARMCRLHNDANVLTMGGRVIGPALALEIVRIFLETPFEDGRHSRRLQLIEEYARSLQNVRQD